MAGYNVNTDKDNEYKYLNDLKANGTPGQQTWADGQIGKLDSFAKNNPYTASTLYSGAAVSGLGDMAKKQYESAAAALKGSYDQSNLALDNEASKIPQQYYAARNQTAGTAAVNRQNFNEYANASGLNSGAGGQAQLAQSAALQGNLNTINTNEANALSDVEARRSQIAAQYQNALAQAKSASELEYYKAQIAEAQRVDNAKISVSANQASLNQSAQSGNINYQTQQEQTAYNRGQTDKEYAYSHVQTMIAAGQMPSEAMIAASGIPLADVKAMQAYNAQRLTPKPTYSGGGSSSGGSGGYKSTVATPAADIVPTDYSKAVSYMNENGVPNKISSAVMSQDEFSREKRAGEEGAREYATYKDYLAAYYKWAQEQ